MAITSLKPLKQDHIWVKLYENKQQIIDLFSNDIPTFFVELLTSHENIMTLGDIKAEITTKFLNKSDEWSKWWNKAKVLLKRSPYRFQSKEKDEIIYRQNQFL